MNSLNSCSLSAQQWSSIFDDIQCNATPPSPLNVYLVVMVVIMVVMVLILNRPSWTTAAWEIWRRLLEDIANTKKRIPLQLMFTSFNVMASCDFFGSRFVIGLSQTRKLALQCTGRELLSNWTEANFGCVAVCSSQGLPVMSPPHNPSSLKLNGGQTIRVQKYRPSKMFLCHYKISNYSILLLQDCTVG